jgi:SAM-dependent methyltransferase
VHDPIGGHPTRGEQLDVLVEIVTDLAEPGDLVLDLGCGTGYLEHLLLARRHDLKLIGVDRKGASLDEGRARFSERRSWRGTSATRRRSGCRSTGPGSWSAR